MEKTFRGPEGRNGKFGDVSSCLVGWLPVCATTRQVPPGATRSLLFQFEIVIVKGNFHVTLGILMYSSRLPTSNVKRTLPVRVNNFNIWDSALARK